MGSIDNCNVNIHFWDISSHKESDELRILNYANTDIFLLCFAMNDSQSLQNLEKKWNPEVSQFSKNSIRFVVGNKIDLLLDTSSTMKKKEIVLSKREIGTCVKRIGAVDYCMCS